MKERYRGGVNRRMARANLTLSPLTVLALAALAVIVFAIAWASS